MKVWDNGEQLSKYLITKFEFSLEIKTKTLIFVGKNNCLHSKIPYRGRKTFHLQKTNKFETFKVLENMK